MSARSIKILFIGWTALAGFISFMGLLVGDTWQVLAGFWGLLWGITVLDLRDEIKETREIREELKEARKQVSTMVEELQKVRQILDLEQKVR